MFVSLSLMCSHTSGAVAVLGAVVVLSCVVVDDISVVGEAVVVSAMAVVVSAMFVVVAGGSKNARIFISTRVGCQLSACHVFHRIAVGNGAVYRHSLVR